ncbi:MAG: hypothetical protein QXM75_01610 [Candidatus Diapherotrites archaeon]
MRKGFVITISIAIILSVLLLSASYYLKKNREEQKIIFDSVSALVVADIADDIAQDAKNVLGFSINTEKKLDSTFVKIEDSVPMHASNESIEAWKKFIESNYAPKKNAVISICNLTPETELYFPNGLKYKRSKTEYYVLLYMPNSETNVFSYDINLSIEHGSYDDENSSKWSCDSGSTKVTLRIIDYSGEKVERVCNISNSNTYEYLIKFQNIGGDVNVTVGRIGNSTGALKIQNNLVGGHAIDINFSFSIPPTQPSAFLPCSLNVSMGSTSWDGNITFGSG